MTKNDLQTGVVLEFENGERAIVIRSIYGDGIYYANDGCNEQDDLRILTDDLLHTSKFRPDYNKVVRVLKTNGALACLRPDRIATTCKNATEVLWERTIYPKWFKSKKDGRIVKFIGLNKGIVIIQGTNRNSDPVGHSCSSYVEHTCTDLWAEVPEPIKEMTMEELEAFHGCKIKITAKHSGTLKENT